MFVVQIGKYKGAPGLKAPLLRPVQARNLKAPPLTISVPPSTPPRPTSSRPPPSPATLDLLGEVVTELRTQQRSIDTLTSEVEKLVKAMDEQLGAQQLADYRAK